MNQTLSTFMSVAAAISILVVLYYGITFKALESKHKSDATVIEQYQIQPK